MNRTEYTSRPPFTGCISSNNYCTNSKYRTLDGSCNNFNYPMWGAANTRYGRLLPSKYGDGK